jgi:hypothetical protein
MVRTTAQRALPLLRPMPNSAPTETWVVETGNPRRLATVTSKAVTRLPLKPWPGVIAVMRWLMVSATLRALSTPPSAIAMATRASPKRGDSACAPSSRATIFGVSLSPRARQTAPPLRKCRPSSMRPASQPSTRPE